MIPSKGLPDGFNPSTDCAYCRDRQPSDQNCEVHRLHTEPDFKEAWELTDGRFQVYVCDGCVETRNRTLCTALSERDAALIAKALTAYLDALWGKP